MKKYIILFIGIALFYACSEDQIGQYPIDGTPPPPISNAKVINFQGGSTITYDLPDETDLLYVRTRFTLPNGKVQDIKTSVFSNSITVKGFARSQKYNLELVAVDRSQNESEPLLVEIEPEDAIIFDIIRSISYETARGGFKVTWENEIQEEVTVSFLRKNDATGNFEPIEDIYTSAKTARRAIRGQEAKPTTYAVYAKDTYNNYSDTLKFELEPLFETLIDNKKFLAMPKLSSFILHGWSNASLSVLWDDVLIGDKAGTVYYIQASDINAYFTLDLGQKVKLSRFRMWGRADYYFRLHNPYDFYLMGTNDATVAQNPASTDSQWTQLINCISYRPSGLDSSQPATEEDYAFAAAGEEFEFSDNVAEVRYIRFRVRKAWGGSNGLHIAELRFWGEPIN